MPAGDVTDPTSEHAMRMLIDSIPALVFTMTATGQLDWVNRPLLEYFARSLDDLRSWRYTDVVHPDDLPGTIEAWQRGAASGRPFAFEQRLLRADGQYRWFQFRAEPARTTDGVLVRWYGTVSDIDDLKRAEEELRTFQARFARAAHLAATSELAAAIAHEINQPLAALMTHAEACHRWLSATPPNVARALSSAERVARDGHAAAQVVSRIRALFRQTPPEKRPVDINAVIRDACRMLEDEARTREISMRVELAPRLPAVSADPVQMQQLVANLVRNALESVDGADPERRVVRISSAVLDGWILSHVADFGAGVRDAQAIFEPFYSTKPNGMGMGLVVCRTIIEAHGGRLWTEPNLPHGAVFAFGLPADAVGATAPHPEA